MTTGPSISVKADISGFQSALQKLEQEAKRVNSTLDSMQFGIDTDDASRQLKTLQKAADELVSTIDKAGDAGTLDPKAAEAMASALEDAAKAAGDLETAISHSSGASSGLAQNAKHARSLEDNIKRATRAQDILAREGIRLNRQQAQDAQRQYEQLRRSGAAGSARLSPHFDDWVSGGWRNHSTSLSASERRRGEVMRHLGIGGQPSNHRYARMNAMAGALGGLGGSLMGGGEGGIMQMAGSAAGSGMGMLAGMKFGGPVGMAVGMFASKLLGGAGGSVDNHLDSANNEAIIFADMRRMLGATTVDFEMLRGSVRHLSDGLGVSYNELAKMSKDFAHTAGLHGDSALSIGGEVRSATGFARGYGIDPAMTSQFMANMRHFGVTNNERDSKRLALMIGESVQRGGTQGKMDEVLGTLQSFVQSATRASLSSANLGAYSSFMSSMTGLNLPGMKGDPTNAASAMGSADAAMRQGGAFGDASRSFSLGIWQRKLDGFSAYDLGYMNDQGAFGTVGKAFGRDSAAYAMAKANGDHAKMAQYDRWTANDSGQSILSMQMGEMERQYGFSTDKLHNSIKGHFGVTDSQASALYAAYKNDPGLGSLEKSLSASGVDISKLNTKSIAALAELSAGGMDGIIKQSGRLRGMKLSKEDEGILDKANASGGDTLKAAVLKLSSKYDNLDQGEVERQQQADMANALQALATKLIPLTQWIKDGVVEIVRKLPFGDSGFVQQADRDKRTGEAQQQMVGLTGDARVAKAKELLAEAQKDGGKYNSDFVGSLNSIVGGASYANGRHAGGTIGGLGDGRKSSLGGDEMKAINAAASKYGIDPDLLVSAVRLENSGANAVSPKGAKGRFQIMPSNYEGTGLDPSKFEDGAMLAAKVFSDAKRLGYSTPESQLAYYNGGYPQARAVQAGKLPPAAETRKYLERYSDGKVPSGLAKKGAANSSRNGVDFSGNFTLYDRQGRQMADPILITQNSCPAPAGWG